MEDPLIPLFRREFLRILEILRDAKLTSYKRFIFQQRAKEIGNILQELDQSAQIWLNMAFPRYYNATIKTYQDFLESIGAETKPYTFTGIHVETVNLAIQDTYERIARGLQYVDDTAKRIIREATREIVLRSKLGELTVQEGKRILKRKIEQIGVNAIIDRSGRKWSLDRYTEMLMRTKTMQLSRDAVINKAVEDGYKAVIISEHEGSCPICEPWQGKVLSLGEPLDWTDGTLDEAVGAGLFHPNCYSEDTEVYTNKGWKLFKDIRGDEEILSIQPESNKLEWTGIKEKISYYFEGELLRFYSNSLDLLVTPDHQMYVAFNTHKDNKKTLKWQLIDAEKILDKNFKLLRIPEWRGKADEFIEVAGKTWKTEDFAKFMGYWLSEGHVYKASDNHYQIRISQCREDKLNKIYEDLKDLPYKIYKEKERVYFADKKLGEWLMQFGKANEKYIPEEIKQLDKKYLRLFLEAYLLGDGTIKHNRYKDFESEDRTYFTSSKKMADDLGEVMIKAGYYPSYSLDKVKGKEQKFKNGIYTINNDLWRIRQNNSKHSYYNNSPSERHRGIQVERVAYSGMVYDVELEKNHILWVRRKGKTVWSGNCKHTATPYSKRFAEFKRKYDPAKFEKMIDKALEGAKEEALKELKNAIKEG